MERVAFEFCQLTNSLSICSGEKESSLTQNNVNSINKTHFNLFSNSLFVFIKGNKKAKRNVGENDARAVPHVFELESTSNDGRFERA